QERPEGERIDRARELPRLGPVPRRPGRHRAVDRALEQPEQVVARRAPTERETGETAPEAGESLRPGAVPRGLVAQVGEVRACGDLVSGDDRDRRDARRDVGDEEV